MEEIFHWGSKEAKEILLKHVSDVHYTTCFEHGGIWVNIHNPNIDKQEKSTRPNYH